MHLLKVLRSFFVVLQLFQSRLFGSGIAQATPTPSRPSSAKYNAIVVGGGLGGLTAAASLSKSGKKVLVLDKHYVPGGYASAFKRRDFIMEASLHEMDGLHEGDTKRDIFHYLGIDKNVHFLQVPEIYAFKDSRGTLALQHGYEAFERQLIKDFPHEEKGIKAYVNLMKGILDEMPRMPRGMPKSLIERIRMLKLYPNVVKASGTTVGKWMDKNIKDDRLKLVLTGTLGYYGDDPYTLSMLYFTAGQSGYVGGGGHYIQGGSRMLSGYLLKVVQDAGGQVLLGKDVKKILIENGKAYGVEFLDAFNSSSKPTTVYADSVIINSPIPSLPSMLPEKEGSFFKKQIKKWKPANSLLCMYIGFDANLRSLGVKHYSNVLHSEDVKTLKDINRDSHSDWTKKTVLFVDYGQVDSRLAPKGKSVGTVCGNDYYSEWENLDPEEYRDKKDKIAKGIISRLEINYPGISKHIEYYTIGTSMTMNRFTSNTGGSVYGFAQMKGQSGFKRNFNNNSPAKNLFFASAWSFPGGGYTGVIVGGFLAARVAEEKVEWTKQDSSLVKDSRVVNFLERKMIAKDTFELTFEKPRGFVYYPGQYAVVQLNNFHDKIDLPLRSLSMVSHPSESVLRFAMRTSISTFKQTCMKMKKGDTALLFGPMGSVGLKNLKKDNIAFVVGGIGITPVVPMLQELQRNKFQGKVFLFYSNRSHDLVAYEKEVKSLDGLNYVYVPVITSNRDGSRVDSALIQKYLGRMDSFDYVLVGSGGFVSSIRNILVDSGIKIENIHSDDFG